MARGDSRQRVLEQKEEQEWVHAYILMEVSCHTEPLFLPPYCHPVCCIFHKAKPKNFEDPFADSSSSSSSSDDDSSDESSESECSSCNGENSRNRQTTTSARDGQPSSVKGKERAIDTDNNEEADGLDNNEHSADCPHSTHNHGHKHKSRRLKPNAYEHQPKYGKAKKKRDKGSSTVTITEPPAPGQAEV